MFAATHRQLIMRVMCDRRLDFAGPSREFGFDFAETYAAARQHSQTV